MRLGHARLWNEVVRRGLGCSGWIGATFAVGVAVALVLPAPSPAPAAVAGSNGLIAFAGADDGDLEIYAMPAVADAAPTQLTHNDVLDTYPSWSPDGSRIVFQSNRDGGSEIYVMDADGSDQVRLTNTDDGETDSVFSPDGAQIAFTRWHGVPAVPEIWVMDSDGTDQHEVSTLPPSPGDPYPLRGQSMEPAWSPDGSRIAFTTRRTGNYDIWVMAPDGSAQRPIFVDPLNDDVEPDWFPGGSRLVVRTTSSDSQLIVVNAEDGTSQSLGAVSSAVKPVWSPDGTQIVFSTRVEGHYQLAVIPAEGGAPSLLTTSAADHELAAWQPIQPPPTVSRPDLRVRRSGGPTWTGDDQYPPAPQQIRARVPRRHTATFEVRVQNDGTVAEGFVLRGTAGTSSYGIQYYVGTTRVTKKVVGGTYAVPSLRVGAAGPKLRITVTVGPHARARSARTFTLAARGRNDSGQRDAVRMTVARR
jgi:Tol biopolymer transport system component